MTGQGRQAVAADHKPACCYIVSQIASQPPDLLALHKAYPQRYPYLLESVAKGAANTRFDILFAFPGETLELLTLNDLRLDGKPLANADFLSELDARWQKSHCPHINTALPFTGGWFLCLAYELASQIESILKLPAGQSKLPIAFARRIPAALIYDHQDNTLSLVAEPDHEPLIALMSTDLKQTLPQEQPLTAFNVTLQEELHGRFLDGVQRAKEYILAGDIFQLNLSRIWKGELADRIAPASLYHRLRQANPAPFAGLIQHNDMAVISSSPERLVRVQNGRIDTRPIAGTRPRGSDGYADDLFAKALLAHPKERAEHVMLIDLERNDLGRICQPGSILVDELMVLESYTHVHHIVSNVTGNLKEGVSPADIIRAVFPGGTITGCPKVRCMQIIGELEQAPRGAYTGSMGYLNRDGSMDLNILIRTLVLQGQHISLRAGAGIVADSEPWAELAETRAKARGLLRALGIADECVE